MHRMTNETLPEGRVAIVVGAAGELGRATAVKLADRGMAVVAVDRSEAGLEGLPEGIALEVTDATDANSATPLVERIVHDVGPPDALVNTIGAFQTGDALTTTPDQLRLMIDVNLGSALWLSQAVAPYMQRSGSGAIVHIAARPGIEPSAGMAAYSTSKAALVHLTRILDLELRPLGIRVNSVAPRLLDTARARASFPKEVLAHAVPPEAIAEVVAFLVSEAAAPISGAILPAYGA
jgi:NAD(P)-dependent dehydrogenase (short-subunit alcohol dehydrogenase family)